MSSEDGEPAVVGELGRELAACGWVTDLYVGGSLATGDYVPDVSDLDLVALVAGPVTRTAPPSSRRCIGGLDQGSGAGRDLGCTYVDGARLATVRAAPHVDAWRAGEQTAVRHRARRARAPRVRRLRSATARRSAADECRRRA